MRKAQLPLREQYSALSAQHFIEQAVKQKQPCEKQD
jgi:hypothetical protein